MSDSPFFSALCPSCGAPVSLHTSASAFAVCGYCQSGLAVEGQAFKSRGKVSEVLEDYSPLQLGSSGQYNGLGFTLVGRIQLRYPGGFWNEWYLSFQDGTNGWLSDASGQYAVLVQKPLEQPLTYASLTPGKNVQLLGEAFTVVDRREAKCTGGEGELPFAFQNGWLAPVVDLLSGSRMLTVDFSDEAPVLYEGVPQSLDGLKMQLLRKDAEIQESAGRIRARTYNFSCPSCGHSLPAVAGQTVQSTCPACRSVLDTASAQVQLIERGRAAAKATPRTQLPLGAVGTLKGISWRVMGVVLKSAYFEGERYGWEEYLLHNPQRGFCWLSFSEESGWSLSEQLQRVPRQTSTARVSLESQDFKLKEAYESQVDEARGSFNWEVRAGDRTRTAEYENTRGSAGQRSLLVCEATNSELTWSLCTPLVATAVASAFGLKRVKERSAPLVEGPMSAQTAALASAWAAAAHLPLFLIRPSVGGFLLGCMSAGLYFLLKHWAEEAK